MVAKRCASQTKHATHQLVGGSAHALVDVDTHTLVDTGVLEREHSWRIQPVLKLVLTSIARAKRARNQRGDSDWK